MGRDRPELRADWLAALLLGLISSTFSTLVSQFAAGRIGRDATVDWMVVAAIPLRDAAIHADPPASSIAAGILFHQWADFSWVLVFFGVLGRWTARLGPLPLLALAAPWAALTSALEWLVLVPLVPFRQPIFPLVQVYWIGFLVHFASATMYPLFPALRDRIAGRAPSPHRRFALRWSAAAVAGIILLAGLDAAGRSGREPPHLGAQAFDRTYMRRMTAHHRQGVALADLGAARASEPRLRTLARLISASQAGEIALFERWWRSWFGGPLPPPTHEEHARMPGMLEEEDIAALRTLAGPAFDARFVELMSVHHRGAIAMADEALSQAGDPRLAIMAHAIRHSQTGEIALMHGSEGVEAVRTAIGAMLR